MMEGGIVTGLLVGAAGICAVISVVILVLMWTPELSDRRRSAVCRLVLVCLYEQGDPAAESTIATFVQRNGFWFIKPGAMELRRGLSLLEARGYVSRVYGSPKGCDEKEFFEDARAEITTFGRWRAREIMVGEEPKAFQEIGL